MKMLAAIGIRAGVSKLVISIDELEVINQVKQNDGFVIVQYTEI